MSRIIRNAKLHVTHPGKTLNIDEREVIAKSFWSRQASCIVLERERTSPASVLIAGNASDVGEQRGCGFYPMIGADAREDR